MAQDVFLGMPFAPVLAIVSYVRIGLVSGCYIPKLVSKFGAADIDSRCSARHAPNQLWDLGCVACIWAFSRRPSPCLYPHMQSMLEACTRSPVFSSGENL